VSGLSGEWLVILVFVSSALPMGLSIDWYFQGKGRIATVAASKVLMFCVYLALVYILVRSPGDTVMVGIAYLAANSVSAVWLFSLFRREAGSMSFRWNPRRWRELVRQSIPLGASLLLSQSTANVPVLLAGTLLTAHETGLFSASMKLIVFCLMVDRIFYVVFFPVLTRYRQMRESQFPQLVAVGLKVMLAVSVPIFICGVAFAGMIVPVVFGSGYEEAVLVFQLLLPFFLFTTTNTVWMSVLYADSRDTDFLHVMILGSIVLIILCGVLSVILGIAGTAISISVSEGLMTVLLLMKGRKILSLRYGKIFLPLFISGAAMAGVLAAVQVIPSFAALLAALGCYAVLLVVLGGLTQNDIRFLKEKFV
jgi:PST family polysaccharide transporter